MDATEELLLRSGFQKWDKLLFVKILVNRKGNYRGGRLHFYLPGYDRGELYDRYIFDAEYKNGVILVRYIDMVYNENNKEFIVSNGFDVYELYEKIWNEVVEEIRKNVRKTTTNRL